MGPGGDAPPGPNSFGARADSAGLAVLLDWLAWGRRRSHRVSLENLPASLLAIAKISEVDGLLTATG